MRHTQKHAHARTHLPRRGGRTDGQSQYPGGELPDTSPQGERAAGAAARRRLREWRGRRLTWVLSSPSTSQEGGNEPSCRATSAKFEMVRPIPPREAGGLSQGYRPRRADTDGRSQRGIDAGGRTDTHARAARGGTGRPLVLVPYLGELKIPTAPSRIESRPDEYRCKKRKYPFPPGHSTKWEAATSQTALNATEGLKHVLCSRSDTPLNKIGRAPVAGVPVALLGTTFDCENHHRWHVANAWRPRNLNERCNVLTSPSELPQLITVSQFGQRLGVCRRTVERLIATQKIRVCKIGRSTRISVSELVRYIASLHGEPNANGGAS